MKDFRKEADADLLRLWRKLERKGYWPILHQFQFLIGKEKGDLLTDIRAGWKKYITEANNFNADGSLKNKLDLFPIHLCTGLSGKKSDERLDSINFSLDYSPENGLHISTLYMLRVYRIDSYIQLDIKHKPGELPDVKQLTRLMEKTEREQGNDLSIKKEVDLSGKVRKIGKGI